MNFQDYDVPDFVCDESFQRYCLDDNDDDIAFWKKWLNEHPEKKAAALEARGLIAMLSARQGGRISQLKHLEDGIERYNFLQEAVTTTTSRSRWKPLKYAAVLGGGLLLAGSVWLFSRQQPAKDALVVINAGNGPRKTVVLPDGSSIVLRENSTVQLEPGFNNTNRTLSLSGEAFFDVSQHARHPFIVHTPAFDIKVLGTVFNVSAYGGNQETTAALFKGKVEITLTGQPGQRIILQPNQKLTTHAAAPFAVMPLDADPVDHKAKEIAWVRSRLEIENEPLETIAGKLEKWYGIKVVFADDTVKQYRYSGTFESETILKALDALQLSYPFNYKMQNNQIVISK